MNKMIVANWKDRISPRVAEKWLEEFSGGYTPAAGLEVVLAVPFIILAEVARRCRDLPGVRLAVQDVSPYPPGGYTGATPAAWLEGRAGYALVGHQERRRYFHESDQEAANKVSAATAAGVTPILCADEQGIRRQLGAIESGDLRGLVLAYTPADAVSLEVARQADRVAAEARRFAGLSGGCPVLYGGGVNADNVASLLALPELAGIMTAAGCLEAGGFLQLLANARQVAGGAAG